MATARTVADFREQYRREHVPARYRGGLHLAFTFGVGGAVLLWSAMQLAAVRPLEWLTVPLTFLYANFAEYWGHRGPMHHLKRGLRLVYERHTRQHHRFFTHETMALDGPRDLRPDHPIARWSLVRRLEPLHRAHHDPTLMARRNFNITYPVCDALFGTLQRN